MKVMGLSKVMRIITMTLVLAFVLALSIMTQGMKMNLVMVVLDLQVLLPSPGS